MVVLQVVLVTTSFRIAKSFDCAMVLWGYSTLGVAAKCSFLTYYFIADTQGRLQCKVTNSIMDGVLIYLYVISWCRNGTFSYPFVFMKTIFRFSFCHDAQIWSISSVVYVG